MACEWDREFVAELSDASMLQEPEKEIVSRAINHSFGRGGWRARAERVVLPRVALDAIIKQCGSESWSEQEKRLESPRKTGGESWNDCPKGKRTTRQMAGVSGAPAKPKSSGRARALRIRAEKCILPQRKPGKLPGQHGATPLTPPSSAPSSGIPLRSQSDHSPHSGCVPSSSQMREPGTLSTACQNQVEYQRHWPIMNLPDGINNSGSTDTTSSPLSLELAESSSSSQGDPSLGKWLQGSTDKTDWDLDTNTLCINNFPTTATVKDLKDAVDAFGNVTHCCILPHLNEAQLATAYVRMEERSACHWVISCFHGNPLVGFEDSALPLVVYFATKGSEL